MSINREPLTYEQFVVYLRSALHYLYDPVSLRRSPLVELLGLAEEFDRADALQKALSTAIRAMKPSDAESPQSRAWRIYDTLSLQYLRHLPRETVANQLGISERQMRREQRLAVETLARQLWQMLAPARVLQPDNGGSPNPQPAERTAPRAEMRIPLGDALENVRGLAAPLAQQMGVPLEIYISADLVDLPVSPMPLRTILLTVLTVAIPKAGTAAVIMNATPRPGEIAIEVTCGNPAVQASLTAKDMAALATAQEQAAFYGVHLDISGPEPNGFAVTLLQSVPPQLMVLVVDDNVDWLELVQRYAAGAPYQIVTTRSPETACASAASLQPSLILLDVMMHGVDGWQVLSELRHNPATSHIPVVVCTILPLQEMALALGAEAFLQKPVSQQQFLHLLDRLRGL